MGLIFRLAWRNIWRQPRRAGLTLAAIIFSDVILVWMIGLQLGQYDLMIKNTLNTFTGQIQIQQQHYREKSAIRDTVGNADAIAGAIREALHSDGVAIRAFGFALVSSAKRSYGTEIVGVQAAYEPKISRIPNMLSNGQYLQAGDYDQAVIGSVLARNLKLDVGEEITVLGSAKDGSVAAAIFKVKGIVTSNVQELDRHMIQIPLSAFQDTFALHDEAHAIVINAGSLETIPEHEALIKRLLPKLSEQKDLSVLDWEALEPGLKAAIQADFTSAWFMYSILVLIVVFSVLNTFLMSVLERTHEFGVMLSLGLTPARLGAWVIWESGLLALLGLILGLIVGVLFTLYFHIYGFTYPGIEDMAKQFNVSTTLYPALTPYSVALGPSVIFVSTWLSAIYPALRLRKLKPIEAMNAV